jgi:hypothetical protein
MMGTLVPFGAGQVSPGKRRTESRFLTKIFGYDGSDMTSLRRRGASPNQLVVQYDSQ